MTNCIYTFFLIRNPYFCQSRNFLKGLYTRGFDLCPESIYVYINSFKNDIKNPKWYPVAMVSRQNPKKNTKNVFKPAKISQDRDVVKN